MPAAPRAHLREQREDEPHRAEVVELHGPLVVVHALVGVVDGAPDRAAGVVHEHVDATVPGEHLGGHALDVREVAEVAAVDVGVAAGGVDRPPHLVEGVAAAGDEEHRAPGRGDPQRRRPADPGGRAGDEHDPARHRALERAAAQAAEQPPREVRRLDEQAAGAADDVGHAYTAPADPARSAAGAPAGTAGVRGGTAAIRR